MTTQVNPEVGKWYEFYFAGIKTQGEYVGVGARGSLRFYGKKFAIYTIQPEMVIGEVKAQTIDWSA